MTMPTRDCAAAALLGAATLAGCTTSHPAGSGSTPAVGQPAGTAPAPVAGDTGVDPVGYAHHVAGLLWGGLPIEQAGRQLTARLDPDLTDAQVAEILDVVDAELATAPARPTGWQVRPASGIDDATTITIITDPPNRGLQLRIRCAPTCRLAGIRR